MKHSIPTRVFIPLLSIFFVSFLYIAFVTADVPIFFEGRQMLAKLVTYPSTYWLSEVFLPGSTNPLGSMGELDGLFVWLLNFLFGFNEHAYRLVKAFFFAGTATLTYILAVKIMKKKLALIATAIILFSFPHFLQTIIFDELFMYAELFKIALLILLLRDKNTPTFMNGVGIFILSFMSFRFYHPAASTLGILIILSVLTKRVKYVLIAIFLLLFLFPRSLSETNLTSPAYYPKTTILYQTFIHGFFDTLTHPIPNLNNLYHRSFWSIITPAGILLLIATFIFARKTKIDFTMRILAAWMLTELPLFIFLPEPAIRYAAGILTPFILLTFYVINTSLSAMNKNKKAVILTIIFLATCMILTNLAYTTVFRATWGSGFIAAGKTIDYLQEKNEHLIVYYAPMQVAPDFVPITTKTKPYSIDTTIQFVSWQPKIAPHSYVIQRITSSGKQYPENIQGIKEKEIIGVQENNLFDLAMTVPRTVTHLQPNKMIIYRSKS